MSQLSHILTQAEQSMQAYNWDKAQQLYQQALDLEPDHPDAQEGLARLRKLREAQEKIAEWIQDGDQQAKAGAYREALQIYIQALAHAGHWGILGLYADLEAKRNRMREAVVWDDRAQETLREAERYGKQEDWKAAGRVLDSLIHEFPQEPLYKPLLATLEQKRREAEARLGAKDLFSQALAALREDGYEQGIRLLEMIPDGDENYTAAQRMLLQARHRWDNRIKPQLQRVEAAIQDKRWADAFAELNTLRTQYPKNSAWQQLWMQVGMGHGQQLLSEGRQANLQRDFQAAQQCFQQAQQAFEKVLEVRPTHITATRLRDESIDLTNIAIEETQAQSDWDAGKREDAKAALERARRRIEHAQGEGRSYAVIPAVVSAMLDTLQREIERIAEDEKRLREAERLLENRRLQEARQKFEDTLNALLPQAKQHATDGLNRVDEQLKQFKQALDRGGSASTPALAVNALQEAHDLWPDEPQARQGLTAMLLRAGESALEQDRLAEAMGYCERALVLDPDNRRAKACKHEIGIKPEVENLLKDVAAGLGELERKENATAQDFDPLLNRLEDMLKRTQDLDELYQQVTPYHERARDLRRQWREHENLSARAGARRQTGDWTGAVQAMDQALGVWQDTVPSHLRRQRERWQAVTQEIERVHSACAASLAQARPIYDGAMESGNLSSALESFSDALDRLQSLEGDFETIEQAAQDEEGDLPRETQDLRDDIRTILGRAQVAREAIKSASPREGLLNIREVIRLQGGDPTMEALAQQLKKEVEGDIPELLKQSETAIETGKLTEALDLLRQVRELQPDNAEIAARYATMERRQQLEDQLRTAENDYRQKLANNSPVDAMAALRRTLDTLLNVKAMLSPQGHDALRELLSLAGLEEGLALGKAAHWQVAQVKLGQLGKLGQESWAATRAFYFADLWAKLAHDVAQRGIVASATQLGNLLEAYEAAADYLKAHPTDGEAIQQLATAEENLIDQLNGSARKRLERARKSLEQGEFELALGNLESIEDDFYGETDTKFPNLLEKRDEVENVRTEIQKLTTEARKLQTLHSQVTPCLKTAEQAFLDGHLADAEQELKAVPSDLSDAPALAQRVEDLRARIRQTRVEQAAKSLRETMARSQTVLRFATTREQLEVFQQELEDMGNQINLELLPIESRENYYQMLDQVREQRESLAGSAAWEQQAEKALQQQDYVAVVSALEKALAQTRKGEKRVEIEARIAEMEKQARVHRERDEAQKLGEDHFYKREYAQARRHLEKARALGAGVDDMWKAARAGALLASAKRFWEEEKDWEGALLDLEDMADLTRDNPRAQDIAREARRLEKRLGKIGGEETELRRDLAAAQRLVTEGKLDDALDKVASVLTQAPENKEASGLQEQIRIELDARTNLEKAEKAYREGKYDDARAFVDTILRLIPNYPPAMTLRQQIEAKQAAQRQQTEAEETMGRVLVQIDILVNSAKFGDANEMLQTAAQEGADPELVRQMQDRIDEGERKHRDKVMGPIETDFLNGRYAEALGRCRAALAQAATPDFRQELLNWQSDVVNRWVDKDMEDLTQGLKRANNDSEAREIVARLEQLLALEPPPDNLRLQRIKNLLQQAHNRRLRFQLALAQQRDDEGAWQVALDMIGKIQEETETLGQAEILVDFDIFTDAITLESAINERVKQERLAEQQASRDKLITEARQLRQDLTRSLDLEQLVELSDRVMSIEGFQDDREAISFKNWAQNELRQFDETRAALEQSKEQIRRRHFDEAWEALHRQAGVSDLLKSDYEQQREIASILQQASADSDPRQGAWESALEGYRSALQQAPELQTLLDNDITRCQDQLMSGVLDQALAHLNAARIDDARAILEDAEEQNWVTSSYQTRLREMRGQIASQEHVSRAENLLQCADGDLAEAQAALGEARSSLPSGQPDADAVIVIRQWELLAKGLLAWQRNDRATAKQCFESLKPPAAGTLRARQLQEWIDHGEELDRSIAEARRGIKQALSARPYAYEKAIEIVQQGFPDKSVDPRIPELRQRVQTPLLADLGTARQTGQYAEAIRLGDLARRLAREDDEILALVERLPKERKEQLEAALQEAGAALDTWQLSEADNALKRASTIAAPEGDDRIGSKRQQVERQRQALPQIHERLRELGALIGKADWEQSIEQLLALRQDAPQYKLVVTAGDDLRARLTTRVEVLQSNQDFPAALDLCEQTLRIESRKELLTLQRNIRAERDERLLSQRQQAERGLDGWDLESASRAISVALKIAPDDASAQRLQQRLQHVESATPDLRRAIENGWERLRKYDYLAAGESFEQGLTLINDFTEARAWRDYAAGTYKAIKAVEDEVFDQAVSQFLEAQGRLHIRRGDSLPSIIGGQNRLRQMRRQWAYHAARLAQAAADMTELDKLRYQYEKQDAGDKLETVLDELWEAKRAFDELKRALAMPAEGFQIDGPPQDVRQRRKEIEQPTITAESPETHQPPIPEEIKEEISRPPKMVTDVVAEVPEKDIYDDQTERETRGGILSRLFGRKRDHDEEPQDQPGAEEPGDGKPERPPSRPPGEEEKTKADQPEILTSADPQVELVEDKPQRPSRPRKREDILAPAPMSESPPGAEPDRGASKTPPTGKDTPVKTDPEEEAVETRTFSMGGSTLHTYSDEK